MLREAVTHFSWLWSHSYADKSALKLVGDHFQLTQRQRIAVMRSACADEALQSRQARRVSRDNVNGRLLLIDGYNILTTVEAGLAGGVLLLGRDGCYRDMASMHGSFRKVKETAPAVSLLGEVLADLKVSRCAWYLDSPVSNSGRLKMVIQQIAAEQGWDWQVELVPNPDAILSGSEGIVVSADSIILNRCKCWFNLAHEVVTTSLPDAYVVDLSDSADPQ